MDLRCRKTNCQFNNKFSCSAKSILVSEKELCSTFKKGEEKPRDTSRSMFEVAPEYASQRRSKGCINCKSGCLFNEDKKCIANGITINSYKEKPVCITYIKK